MTLTLERQAQAYEKLLTYAYTALSVPPPPLEDLVEKGDGNEHAAKGGIKLPHYPTLISPRSAKIWRETLEKMSLRLKQEGVEVLKLNREKRWQPRFLTITKEEIELGGTSILAENVSLPKGLLWVKKLDHNKTYSVTNIGKQGKGGVLCSQIESVSITKDKFSLSKKQSKGKFKDSFTLVLHLDIDGTKRDVFFRCITKEDVCTLSAGFQSVIEGFKANTVAEQNRESTTLHVATNASSMQVPTGVIDSTTTPPTALAKPFNPKAEASPVAEDRWEV